MRDWTTRDIVFVLVGTALLLLLGTSRHRIGELVGTLLGRFIGATIAPTMARRRVRRHEARSRSLAPWRGGLKAGDRCWVIGPRGVPVRMTVHSRAERSVNLMMGIDPADGARCWMDVSLDRLFPERPTEGELEMFELLQRERLSPSKRGTTEGDLG